MMLTHAGVSTVWFMGEREGDKSFKGGYFYTLTLTDVVCLKYKHLLESVHELHSVKWYMTNL